MHEPAPLFEEGRDGLNEPAPLFELPPPPSEAPPTEPPTYDDGVALAGARVKHKRERQDDVFYFSSWPNIGDMLAYAKEQLAPREKESGHKWRIIEREDGRKDRSRDKQWRNYRAVAIAVGMLMRDGATHDQAVGTLQSRFESFGSRGAHTPFLKAIEKEVGKLRTIDADFLAKSVLDF